MRPRIGYLAALISLMIGCVNPYTQFYKGQLDVTKVQNALPPTTELLIYSSNDFQRDITNLIRKGYQPFGESHFNGPSGRDVDSPLRAHAKKIGAHAVLISSKYSHTVNGAMPLTMPTTTTTISSANATAYGSGGTVNVYGSGTSTTYGSNTVMVPYSVARSDFDAVFFYKTTPPRVGIIPGELDQATRKRLQTNFGLVVQILVEGSPAYTANILEGDILIKIANEPVQSIQHYLQLLDKYEGQQTSFVLDRDGRPVEKTVTVRPKQ